MQRSHWRRLLEKDYKTASFKYEDFEGVMGLLVLKKLSDPLVIEDSYGIRKIADTNYKWLEFAFRNQYFWLTTMFDENDNLIELYFDITDGNYFEDINNPCFDDLFVDVVVTGDRKIYVVDEDELEIALNESIITFAQYKKAKNVAKCLCAYLENNLDKIIDYLYICLKTMQENHK